MMVGVVDGGRIPPLPPLLVGVREGLEGSPRLSFSLPSRPLGPRDSLWWQVWRAMARLASAPGFRLCPPAVAGGVAAYPVLGHFVGLRSRDSLSAGLGGVRGDPLSLRPDPPGQAFDELFPCLVVERRSLFWDSNQSSNHLNGWFPVAAMCLR